MSEKQDILSQFPSVFSGLGTMGPEYEIKLQPDAVPYPIFTPRSIPLPLRDKVQEELNKMERNGVNTVVCRNFIHTKEVRRDTSVCGS